MFRLLKWEAQFVLAVLGLVFRFGIWLARLPFRNRSQPHAAPQLPQPPIARPSMPAPIGAPANIPPPIHVTINLPPEAMPHSPAPKPQSLTSLPTAATILANPDHRIYVTSGSHLMIPHPREAELLERLDHMLYVAAHRDGAPFTIPPALDDSVPPPTSTPIATPPLDDGFDPVTPHTLPPEDGALWMIRLGHKPERVTGN